MRTAIEIPTETARGGPVERQDGSVIVLCTAELADCTCPEWCERDHDRD